MGIPDSGNTGQWENRKLGYRTGENRAVGRQDNKTTLLSEYRTVGKKEDGVIE